MRTKTFNAADGHLRCQLSFESNGETAKTMKIKAVARTSEIIEVAGWATDENPMGRLLHDLSGYRLRKSEIPMQLDHRGQIIGSWNRFALEDGNLLAYGILKSVQEGDLAERIIKALSGGLPYEASINFGDELQAVDYDEGEEIYVNGRVYEGPATVVSLWYLREISLCALGADPHTSAVIDSTNDETETPATPAISEGFNSYTFNATIAKRKTLSHKGDSDVDLHQEDSVISVEGNCENIVSESTGEVESEGTTEGTEIETPAETETAETVLTAIEAEEVVEAKPEMLSKETLAKWTEKFGAELAIQYSLSGLDEYTATVSYCEHLKEENEKLKHSQSGKVNFVPSDDPGQLRTEKINELVKAGLNKAQAEYVAKYRR